MKIDIVLPTFNRSAILEQVLISYRELQSPKDGWRIILVDNGSTDDTPRVARQFFDQLPIHYVREERKGKTMAVNTGLDLADADLVLFTDDDILPDAGWLIHYERAAENNPEYTIFGGPLTLKWPYSPKPWMVSNQSIEGDCFASTDPSNTSGPHKRIVVGGNFAVRIEVIRQGARFDPAMGPKGNSFPQGNEAEFVNRLMRQGYNTWWVSEAVVQHIVRPEQMSKQWMWARATRAGRGHFRLDVAREGMPPLVFGVPRYIVRDFVHQFARLLKSYIAGDEVQQFEARYYLNYLRGKLLEGWRMRRGEVGT